MSLCFRTISNKLTSFVNTRKQVTTIDCRLPKNIKSSSFLNEFLGAQTTVDTKTKLTDSYYDIYTDVYSFHQKLDKELIKSCKKNKNEILHIPQQSLTNHSRFLNTEPVLNHLLLYNVNIDCKKTKNEYPTRDDIFYNVNNNRLCSKKQMLNTVVNNHLKQNNILLTNGGIIKSQQVNDQKSIRNQEGRPSKEQLEHIFTCLRQDLPNFFIKTLDYTIYSPNLIFINNIKGSETKGIFNYMKQLTWIRTIGHLKFAYVKLDVLKITMNPEDDTIKVRWRISGITGLRALFTLWKFKLWKMKEALNDAEVWYDGFSTYYVGADGKIYKHVMDKMMPDQSKLYDKEKPTEVATKLAMFVGLKNLQTQNSLNEIITILKPYGHCKMTKKLKDYTSSEINTIYVY
ncbi:PREDICTED: uncharacterized protein LOC107066467 [Polistes dominula]|uniref:Uncharacterized protein LOC107066467 n=1 Tax=Polistes dominula TaxID=743375 RepID=A0ABM1I8R4_POLDO|nr:PREDICTED: uncharacterized protein LOC107066467 [Polistes dominula]